MEGEEAPEALVAIVDEGQELAAADRLAGDADRLAGGPGQHRVGVCGERVEVDEGEGRLDPLEDRLEPFMEGGVARVAHLVASLDDGAEPKWVPGLGDRADGGS